MKKGEPPAYLVCASYAAFMGNNEIIQEQLRRQLRFMFNIMDDEAEGKETVKSFFEVQIIKRKERVERDRGSSRGELHAVHPIHNEVLQ